MRKKYSLEFVEYVLGRKLRPWQRELLRSLATASSLRMPSRRLGKSVVTASGPVSGVKAELVLLDDVAEGKS